MVYYLKLVKHLLFNNSVKICWMRGVGELTINYPISYSKYVCPVICSTQSYDSTAINGCYDVNLTQVKIKIVTNAGTHWQEKWALLVIGI